MNSEDRAKANRVLIAEDDPISSRVLQAFMAKWGYDVTCASDGAQALRILQAEEAPRLAILDWMMPGVEGPEICEHVRALADRPYVYILLLTARTQKADLLNGLESGADDYLTKPFDSQELRARLLVGQRILDLQDSLIAAREELRFRATHDALTGIANRAVILDAIHREQSRQLREGGCYGLILSDIDHFKAVNDAHGHLCGDAVLRETANRMVASVRDYDTVGRYGGEEFLILLPSSNSASALGVAERIRRRIEGAPVATETGPIPVTASFGVAVSGEDRQIPAQVLLQMADEALYRAKKRGRNCSEVASADDFSAAYSSLREGGQPAPR